MSVVSEGAKTHEWRSLAQGFQAKDHHKCVSANSHRNHTSVILYLSQATKTTKKTLLILEFHTPGSPWRCTNVATTSRRPVQQYKWRHWDSAMLRTQQRKSIYHICCILIFLYHICCILIFLYHPGSIAGLHGSNFVNLLLNISRWW
jgi:hypothetical protein